jgi:hypothetical protein
MADNANLARMMRECAAHIDRNEFHPSMYQVIGDLHSYAGKHGDAKGQLASTATNSGKTLPATWSALGKKFSSFGIASSEKTKHATSSKNAERLKQELNTTPEDDSWTSWWTGSLGGSDDKPAAPSKPGKPPFQRPTNPKSTLIANGWIEQLRRSKMRVVWKDVLASLVEGRKANEETTLWIQREVHNATTGKAELEALHQIPIKWLQQVKYLDFYGDYRFAIKVYNVSDEFVFRCADEESAQNWILTLRSVKAEQGSNGPSKTIEPQAQQQQEVEATAPLDEGKPASSSSNVASPPVSDGAPASIRSSNSSEPPADAPPSEQAKPRMTVKEMRAIAHGAGINTQGMERFDLERTVARLTQPAVAVTATEEKHRQDVEAARRRQEFEHQESLQRRADADAMDREHDEDKRRQLEEAQRVRVATARRKAEEEEQRRVAEEQRRAAAVADEKRRAAAVAEQRRAVEEQQRRVAEQQAAEQRRRQEEERARAQQHYQQQQQAWQQQQAAQHAWAAQQAAQQQQAAQAAQRAQQAQWQQWQQQQQQQPKYPQQQQQNPFGGAQQQQQRPAAANGDTSTADLKYTKMAAEAKDDGEKVAAVKRNILLHWALQPPHLQHLRPIADLLCTIHTVFPPAFGVAGHDYFGKWTSVNRTYLIPVGSGPDEEKLKKAVRKLRFFLHPDKLPRDLNEEQTFMCKMLWDISSDAWEEFKKRHEELDWIQK